MKFLIVEDDTALNNGIALSLTGDNAIQSYSIADAEKNFDESIDLIILDINLPDGNGVDFCRKIRKTSQVPIIFLTANDMEIDIVTGLESGADDYITKPFSLAVLRARINTVLRRKQPVCNKYEDDSFSFDFENMSFFAHGKPVELSKTEQKLLKVFVFNRGITLSRDTLIDKVWGTGAEFVEENALSVTVKRLRQKLPGIPLKTVYGIGYVWEKQI